MSASQTKNVATQPREVRVELVDNWHSDWPVVLAALERDGHRGALMLDADGWLSARQSLFVAFVNNQVAGHLAFRVRCAENEGRVSISHGRPKVEAAVDSFDVADQYRPAGVVEELLRAGTAHARSLCEQLSGFDASAA